MTWELEHFLILFVLAIGCSSMEKQFPASSRKIQDLLEKGQTPRSEVLQRLCLYLGFWVGLLGVLAGNVGDLSWRVSRYFEGRKPLPDPQSYEDLTWITALLVCPLMVASVSHVVAQLYVCKFRILKKGYKMCSTNFLSAKTLKSRVLKNSSRAVTFSIPFGLLLVSCAVLISCFVHYFLQNVELDQAAVGNWLWSSVWREVLSIGALLAMCGFVDYLWERKRFLREHRMDYKELKDEYKELEGDPFVKGRRRVFHFSLSEAEIEARVRASRVIVVESGVEDGGD